MASSLSPRERIAHLHRRLGFGATPAELDRDEKAGFDATVRRLIDFEPQPEASPWEFVWREKEEADVGAWRFRAWWAYLMLTTETPLREKLALFWHSHFAVSDTKVEDGPMMLGYLQAIREHAAGRFEDLLLAMSQSPAMMRYLDMERAMRGRPNENFARELMELFSLGEGHYTERDVKEVARSLTGWGYLNTFWEMPGNSDQKVKDAMHDRRPFSSFIEMPAMRDDGPKTILGKTKDWRGEEVVRELAHRPEAAHFIAGKLWRFFAYDDPEPKVVDRLAEAFLESRGDVRRTLHAMVRMPEFWSDRCIRQHPKSPAEFCVGLAHSLGAGEKLRSLRAKDADEHTAIPKAVVDHAGYVAWRMERMGQSLLYPPDVSGWKGGQAWLTPAAMTERQQFSGIMIWFDNKVGPAALASLAFVKARNPQHGRDVVDALCEYLDVPLPAASRDVLAKRFPTLDALKNNDWWAGTLDATLRVLIAAPEMHLA